MFSKLLYNIIMRECFCAHLYSKQQQKEYYINEAKLFMHTTQHHTKIHKIKQTQTVYTQALYCHAVEK